MTDGGHCLVDSNILIYLHDAGAPDMQRQAAFVLDYLGDRNRVMLSVQCLTEFVNTVTRRLSFPLTIEEATTSVHEFEQIAVAVHPVTIDVVNDALAAVRLFQMSWWDALIWAVASRNRIPVILTQDRQSQPIISGVRYVDPFDPDFDIGTL